MVHRLAQWPTFPKCRVVARIRSASTWPEIMRMLQSPGPVNMEIARTTAETMATVDLETGETRPEPQVDRHRGARAFDDVVARGRGSWSAR